TMARISSSREPKWCSSMRWLVPTSAATSRSDRPPIPPVAKAVISASSSSLRRRSSGGRGIGPRDVFAADLQALRLELQVAPREPPRHPAEDSADDAALLDPL